MEMGEVARALQTCYNGRGALTAMTTLDVTYREASRGLLTQAHAKLEIGDLRQASEKAWGAAAQMVKAACTLRGWEHDQHRFLWVAARELSNEANDQEMHTLFVVANGLHANFYENTYDADKVALYIGKVEQFVEKVEAMLGG